MDPALDPLIHQETRLRLVALLAGLGEGAEAEFGWLQGVLGLSEGNLSSHLRKLEEAGYVEVRKGYQGRRPRTWVRLTPKGRAAYEAHRQALLRLLGA
jgi:DNA-binding MarR family transcriptional regulator